MTLWVEPDTNLCSGESLLRQALAAHRFRPSAPFEVAAELDREYHPGTYTTHHDVKAANAEFERALAVAEERLAWCVAVHAPRDVLERLRGGLDEVWRTVLEHQSCNVLAGTATHEVYEEVRARYDRARETLRLVQGSTGAILPRARGDARPIETCRPVRVGDEIRFDNGLLHAHVNAKGVLLEIAAQGGRSALAQGNLLAAYRDRPRKLDAWNLDAGYERHHVRVRSMGCEVHDDGVELQMLVGKSPATVRIELRRGEPFLRVACAIDWRESHVLLRLENWLALETDEAIFGTPHGTVRRTARGDSAAERARSEVPGQRFAAASDGRAGLALFALDTYGWSVRALRKGGVQLGHSLLRSPRWPDPLADRGPAQLAWAFAPFEPGVSVGALEAAWEQFAFEPRVRLFRSEDPSALVVACKPAADGDGAIVRVRECDGADRELRLRSGARMRGVQAVDGLERPIDDAVSIEGEEIVARIGAFELRSFRVRF
jgi:alpha-mannosidase